MKYKATLGTTSVLITIFVSLLLAGFVVFLLYRVAVSTEKAEIITAVLTSFFLVTLYTVCYLYRPVAYIIDDKRIVVRRPAKDFEIQLDHVKDAFLVKKDSMMWSERVGGNGGLFGFYGGFRNGFGKMQWFATKLQNFVMIVTDDHQKFVLTPDDTGMVKEIRKIIGLGN